MTNAETISKLNQALEQLITAYEELQNEYTELKDENSALQDKINGLESENRDLEDNVNVLQDSTEKDSTNINSMLGKIEGLLSKKVNSSKEDNKEDVKTPSESVSISSDNDTFELEETPSSAKPFEKKEEEGANNDSSSENKIDLNRMASLLNGFNN